MAKKIKSEFSAKLPGRSLNLGEIQAQIIELYCPTLEV